MLKSLVRLILLIVMPALSVRSDELKLGVAVALSGGVGGSWGTPELQGVKLAVEELNAGTGLGGRKIKMVVEDTHSDTPGTVRAVTKLLTIDKVDLLIGPTWLDLFGAAAPIIEQARVPTITPSAGSKTLNPKRELRWIFTLFPSEIEQFKIMLKVPGRLGIKKVAYILDEDPYWRTFLEVLKDSPPAGITEVAREIFPSGALEYKSALIRLKNLAPDAFIGGFASQDATHVFYKQMRALGMNIPVISVDTLCELRLEPAFKNLLEGTICAYFDSELDHKFAERFKDKFQTAATPLSSRGYDAVMVFEQALKENNDLRLLPMTIENKRFHAVTYGEFQFDQYHGVNGGKFVAKRLIADKTENLK